jgi:hypothetical protein
MAGKIIADTIEHSSAGSVDTTYVVNGSSKAWVNYNNSGTVAARDSFNISSLTDNATGDTSSSYTNSFSNVNYATASTCSLSDGSATNLGNLGLICPPRNAYGQTTGDVRMNHIYNTASANTAFFDTQLNTIIFAGDLA